MSSAVKLDVRLQPRGGRDGIVGWRDDRLLVRVSAPPVDGRANAALRKLLAAELRVPKGRVAVVHGATSRDKVVAVDGLTREQLLAALPPR